MRTRRDAKRKQLSALMDDPWSIDDDGSGICLPIAIAAGLLALALVLGIIKVHDRHKARAAAGEIECYYGVGKGCK